MKTIHLINPAAGKGRYADINTLDGEVYLTKGRGDAVGYLRERLSGEGEYTVCAYGGDGTLNEAVNGIMAAGAGERTVLVPVPTGSGNDFYKITRELSSPVLCDVVEFNGRYAINEINIGFDCGVVIRTDKIKKSRFISGRAAYIISVMGELLNKHTTRMKITLKTASGDEIHDDNYLLTAITNGRYYGGGFMAAPAAEINDGTLDVIIVNDISIPAFASIIGDYKNGTHINTQTLEVSPKLRGKLTYHHCSELIIEGVDTFCADGEILAAENNILRIKNIPHALYVCGSPANAAALPVSVRA